MLHNAYSHHFHEVPHPHVPFNGEIPHGLEPGKQIFIAGVVGHGDQFRFDLETRSGGCVFVINPRFHLGEIVRNTDHHGNGAWGPEEKHGPFVFQHGQPFELIISVDHDKYHVAINGNHVFDYNHRVPISEVAKLTIAGDVSVHRIVYSGGANARENAIHSPSLPFSAPVFGSRGVSNGRLVQIHGDIPHDANRFEIDLQDGPGVQPNNLGFCFNVRFDDPYTGQAVVRVNRIHGGWGQEEREVSHFPFHKGGKFEMLLLVKDHKVKVAINGQHYIDYMLKAPLHELNHLGISGSVHVHAIRVF
jgi:hypothetical protein